MNNRTVDIISSPCVISKKADTVVKNRLAENIQFEECRWLYILTMPISWLLTFWVMVKKSICFRFGKLNLNINTFWFDGLGLTCRGIKDGAASWRALDIIYNHEFGKKKGVGGIVDNFWVGMINAQAVRNRLKIAKNEIRRAISEFKNEDEIRLLSLAAGSAQGVIEIMAEFQSMGVNVRAILVDIDQTALDYAMKLAESYGVDGQIETIKTGAAQVARISKKFQPHIIEMLGLLDYIPHDKAIRLIGSIHNSLGSGGIFLTCNVCDNIERRFLKWVINWSMIYRNVNELTKIIRGGNFTDYWFVYEPHKVHCLVIARKE